MNSWFIFAYNELQTMKKPVKKSKIRILAGTIFHSSRKFFYWHMSKTTFGCKHPDFLPVTIFSHRTILRRKLKNVDMWMQENKIANLKIAVKKLDSITLKPGETFSYWRAIGNPTKRKGYLEGMILQNGNVTSGTGGGLCQLSNLIYWITLHTPLTIKERWRHTYDVFPDVKRNQPFGSGATCSYPNIDLEIKNDTNQTFQLKLKVGDEYLEGRWLSDQPVPYSYKVFEKKHEIKFEWCGVYSRNNEIFRNKTDNKGKIISEEFVTENHAIMMYNPLLEYK